MNILIGEISSYKAIVISKFIKKNYVNATIFTYDKKKWTNYIRSRYSDKHFYIDVDNFENELLSLIEKNNIDFFFPVINNTLSIILKNIDSYGKSLGYLGNVASFKILNNKVSLYNLAKKLHIKVPEKYNSIEDAKFPYVIKPTNLSSAIGVNYIFSKKDLTKIKSIENSIIQQFVEGTGVGYSFYCKHGKITHGYGHKRLAEIPVTGGSSTYRTYYHNNNMHEIASKIVAELEYTGFAMFEFKLTSDNELYLLEVNPRIWGSINQGMVDGNVNYFEEILGPGIEKSFGIGNVNTYIAPLVYKSFFKYILRFQFKPFFLFLSKFYKNKADVEIFKDPKGYISTILRKL